MSKPANLELLPNIPRMIVGSNQKAHSKHHQRPHPLQDPENPEPPPPKDPLKDQKNAHSRMLQDPKKPLPPNILKDHKPEKISGPPDDKHNKYKSEGDEQLTIEQYLENIRPHLRDMINHFKKSGKQKINSASSKGSCEERKMQSKRDYRQIMVGNDTCEIIE